jgi:hypothetical protein
MKSDDNKMSSTDSPLLGSYFGLVAQRQRLRSDIKLKREEIRNLEREVRKLNGELESKANEISRGER